MKIRNLPRKLGAGAAILLTRLGGRPRPLAVGWSVTKRCNYRCRYCQVWKEKGELATPDALRLIGEIADAGALILGLTGGEPLLRDDIGRLIRHARSLGLTVFLNSNGALVPERVDVLDGVGRLTISLEGPRDVHDAVRGSGAFDQALRAVSLARESGVPTRLAATINAANVDRIQEVLYLASSLSVKVTFQPALAHMLGGEADNRVRPDPDAYRVAMAGLIRSRGRFLPSTIGNSYSNLLHLACWPQDAYVRCAGGLIGCRIEPMGDVYHCARVRIDRPVKNAGESGFQACFDSLEPIGCHQCWCAPRMELNLLHQLKADVVLNTLLST